MRTANIVLEREHLNWHGIQKIYKFDNDFGASVICAGEWKNNLEARQLKLIGMMGIMFGVKNMDRSHGYDEGLWELAIFKNDLFCKEETDIFTIDGVLGYLTEEQVDELLEKISQLDKNGKLTEH